MKKKSGFIKNGRTTPHNPKFEKYRNALKGKLNFFLKIKSFEGSLPFAVPKFSGSENPSPFSIPQDDSVDFDMSAMSRSMIYVFIE